MKCLWIFALVAAAGAAQAANIQVWTATYGQSCNVVPGNVTSPIKAACDRRPSCSVRVDVATLGDSAPNCAKNMVVLYECGDAQMRVAQLPAEAHGRTLAISCLPAERPATTR